MAGERSIRRLVPADTASLIALRRAALDGEPLAFGASIQDDKGLSVDFVRAALGDRDTQAVFASFDDAGMAGMVGIVRAATVKRRHRATIWGMYVAPRARRQGIGRALLDAAIAQARAWTGVEQVCLSVTDAAPGALALYRSAGFRVWGREPCALRWQQRSTDELHLILDLLPA